jgi:hypothetical protein
MQYYTREILDYLDTWAKSTEKIVGAAIRKAGVTISEPDQRNILIDIFQKGLDTIGIEIIASDVLRFLDMGAGRGWRKGKKISPQFTRKNDKSNPRIKKSVWNRPLYKRIARLQEVVTVKIIEEAVSTFPKKI